MLSESEKIPSGPCHKNPCQNAGICTDFKDGYQCMCAPKYVGKHCETTRQCADNPCKNGGICTDTENGYLCMCAPKYLGENCEITSHCFGNPCKNGGTCRDLGNRYQCICDPEYMGRNCEMRSQCFLNPCENGGACRDFGNEYECICAPEYVGRNCETRIENKASNLTTYESSNFTFYFNRTTDEPNNFTTDFNGTTYEPSNFTFYFNQTTDEPNNFTTDFNGTTYEPSHFTYFFNQTEDEQYNFTTDLNTTTYEPSSFTYNFNLTTDEPFDFTTDVSSTTESGCDCGAKSYYCNFSSDGRRICSCLPGYAQMGNLCSDCYCGENSKGCSFDSDGNKICVCSKGFSQKHQSCSRTCSRDQDCMNGGLCQRGPGGEAAFCHCRTNFRGDRCEENMICVKFNPVCEAIGAVCRIHMMAPVCECPPGKAFRPESGFCEDICDDTKCLNGICLIQGSSYKCKCDEGFHGKRCDQQGAYDLDSELLWIVFFSLILTVVILLIGTCCLVSRVVCVSKKTPDNAY